MTASSETDAEMPRGSQTSPPVSSPTPSLKRRATGGGTSHPSKAAGGMPHKRTVRDVQQLCVSLSMPHTGSCSSSPSA